MCACVHLSLLRRHHIHPFRLCLSKQWCICWKYFLYLTKFVFNQFFYKWFNLFLFISDFPNAFDMLYCRLECVCWVLCELCNCQHDRVLTLCHCWLSRQYRTAGDLWPKPWWVCSVTLLKTIKNYSFPEPSNRFHFFRETLKACFVLTQPSCSSFSIINISKFVSNLAYFSIVLHIDVTSSRH